MLIDVIFGTIAVFAFVGIVGICVMVIMYILFGRNGGDSE